MILTKILIDLNICLDVALKRKPFVLESAKVMAAAEEEKVTGFVATHGFDTMFYILSKRYSTADTYDAIEGLRRSVKPANVNGSIIDEAMKSRWADFEDAIHYQAALQAGCDAIITRNPKDFSGAALPVLSPREFLALRASGEEE